MRVVVKSAHQNFQHIDMTVAAEYRCKYDIFEGLLSAYSLAAHTQRHIFNTDKNDGQQQTKDVRYALQIYEQGRAGVKSKDDPSVKRGSTEMTTLKESE